MHRIVYSMTALILLGNLTAGDAAPEGPVKSSVDHQARPMLAKFDTNKDGKISDDEWVAAIEAREAWIMEHHPEAYAKLDANGDGTISREERLALRKTVEEHHKDRLDKNDDGKVGPGERRIADRREDARDHREDVRDRREDKRDAAHQGGALDSLEDILDKAEDRRDRAEDRRDRGENHRERPEHKR